jgi:hypothetical protein
LHLLQFPPRPLLTPFMNVILLLSSTIQSFPLSHPSSIYLIPVKLIVHFLVSLNLSWLVLLLIIMSRLFLLLHLLPRRIQ